MSTIITRNSATSGSAPSSLVQGELAINVTDNRLFFGSGSGNVVKEFGISSSYALTASYAVSASFEINYETSSSYADYAVSASNSLTASYVNPLNQTVEITGSLQVQNSIDSSLRFLFDSTGTASLDWEDGYLYNGSGSISADWRDRKLYDSNVDNSVNWNSRQLFKSDGTTVTLDWETGAFTGSMLGTSSYAAQALSSSYALSASYATTASFASTASFINVTGSNVFVQNGNSFGATALLGTNDNNSLAFETNATTRMFVSSSGIVGVRTTTPEYTFDVSGSIRANGSFVFATDGAGGNGLFFQRNSNNNWTWGSTSPGIGNVMTIAGNSITLPQVVYSTNGLNVTPGGNQTTLGLGVTVGAYPSATLATFSSGSVIALTISGSGMRGTGSFSYLGNITATSFTGSLLGTASYATQALSSSYALTASYVQNAQTASYVLQAVSASYATTASYVLQAVSASYATQALSSSFATTASYIQTAQTASYVLNAVSASYAITASYVQIAQTASYVLNAVSASFATTSSHVNPLRQTVQVTGSLNVTGSVYINNALYSNQTNTLATENKILYAIPTSTYDALFVEYVAKNGSNVRAGQIMSATDGTNAKFTETTTTDLGLTTPLTFNISVAGGNIQLEASASTSTWTVKTITRTI
jgi:hypothetical protein